MFVGSENQSVLLSVIEWVNIYYLLYLIDGKNRLSKGFCIILAVVIVLLTMLLNWHQIVFKPIIILLIISISMKLITSEKWHELFTDAILAGIVLLVIQICAMEIIYPVFGNTVSQNKMLIDIGWKTALIAKFSSGSIHLNYALERYYRPKRKLSLCICLCVMVMMMLIV